MGVVVEVFIGGELFDDPHLVNIVRRYVNQAKLSVKSANYEDDIQFKELALPFDQGRLSSPPSRMGRSGGAFSPKRLTNGGASASTVSGGQRASTAFSASNTGNLFEESFGVTMSPTAGITRLRHNESVDFMEQKKRAYSPTRLPPATAGHDGGSPRINRAGGGSPKRTLSNGMLGMAAGGGNPGGDVGQDISFWI